MDRGNTKQNNEDDYYNPIDSPLLPTDTTDFIPTKDSGGRVPGVQNSRRNDELSNENMLSAEDSIEAEVANTNDSERRSIANLASSDKVPNDEFSFIDKGKKSKKKTSRAIIGIFGVGGMGLLLVVSLVLFLVLFRQEHLRNLLWDYRMARLHRLVGRQINNLSRVSTAGIMDTSPQKAILFERTSLYQKLRGFTPDRAFNSLAKGGLQVEVDGVGLKGFQKSRITSFTDPRTGNKISSSAVGRAEFNRLLMTASDSALDATDHSQWFKRQTRKTLQSQLKIRFGDRFRDFRAERSRGTPPRAALSTVDQKNSLGARPPPAPRGQTADARRAANEDVGNMKPGGNRDVTNGPKSKTANALKGAKSLGGTMASLSSTIFVVSMGCIMSELSNEIGEVLTQRIEGPMRLAAQQKGEAEQVKSGNELDYEMMDLRYQQLSRAEDSAAMQRITGKPEVEIPESLKLDPSDLPFTFFGFETGLIIDAINIFSAPARIIPSPVVDVVCGAILNPVTQVGILAIELPLLFSGIGAALRAGTQGVRLAIQSMLKVGLSVSFNLFLFGYFMPAFIGALHGASGMLHGDDPNNFDQIDLGDALLGNTGARLSGFSEVSAGQAYQDQQEAMYAVKKLAHQEYGLLASINPANPYSLTTQFAITMPSNPTAAIGSIFSRALGESLTTKPFANLSSMFTGRAAAQGSGEIYMYGDQYLGLPMYTGEEILDLALELDGEPGRLDELVNEYKHCFTDSTVSIYFGGMFGIPSTDRSKCNDSMHRKLGAYQALSCGTPLISDSSTFNDCSIIPGLGDITLGDDEGMIFAVRDELLIENETYAEHDDEDYYEPTCIPEETLELVPGLSESVGYANNKECITIDDIIFSYNDNPISISNLVGKLGISVRSTLSKLASQLKSEVADINIEMAIRQKKDYEITS